MEEEVFNGPIPEETPMGDDPILMLSQLQSKKLWNLDENQRRLQADEEANGINNPNEDLQVDETNLQDLEANEINVSELNPNIDPILEEISPPEIDNDDHVENLVQDDPFVEVNTHIRIN